MVETSSSPIKTPARPTLLPCSPLTSQSLSKPLCSSQSTEEARRSSSLRHHQRPPRAPGVGLGGAPGHLSHSGGSNRVGAPGIGRIDPFPFTDTAGASRR
jgi:hypothetical protein